MVLIILNSKRNTNKAHPPNPIYYHDKDEIGCVYDILECDYVSSFQRAGACLPLWVRHRF